MGQFYGESNKLYTQQQQLKLTWFESEHNKIDNLRLKIAQVNSVYGTGSTGRIMQSISHILTASGHKCLNAYARGIYQGDDDTVKIGGDINLIANGLYSFLLDRQGFGPKNATNRLIDNLKLFKPDIVGLHNLHGYYINVETLFEYLKKEGIPVIWTFHDCWPFTGHCSHFDFIDCTKWQTHCNKCPLKSKYPKSMLLDNSYQNFINKREAFSGHPDLTIITPSHWLANLIPHSFLHQYPVKIIPNGIDVEVFKPEVESKIRQEKIVLGVANTWDRIKGLGSFIELRQLLPNEYKIVLIGLSKKQIQELPEGITGLERTSNLQELVGWYNKAFVYLNPTFVDTFPTTNLEALACGTPVVTFQTGGSPESIDEDTGIVVKKGDVQGLKDAILRIEAKDIHKLRINCRKKALYDFNKNDCFQKYLELYEVIGTRNKILSSN